MRMKRSLCCHYCDRPEVHRLTRWSTAELIGIERHVVGRATARADQGTAIVPDKVLADVMDRHPTLASEQVEMVTRLCTSGSGIDVVCAAAVTGKTYTLDAARESWESSGHRVIGATLAGIAAQERQSTVIDVAECF